MNRLGSQVVQNIIIFNERQKVAVRPTITTAMPVDSDFHLATKNAPTFVREQDPVIVLWNQR